MADRRGYGTVLSRGLRGGATQATAHNTRGNDLLLLIPAVEATEWLAEVERRLRKLTEPPVRKSDPLCQLEIRSADRLLRRSKIAAPSSKPVPNSARLAGSGAVEDGGVVEDAVSDGTIISIPVPVAPEATRIVPVKPRADTPANVVEACPPFRFAVSDEPLLPVNKTLPVPVAPVPRSNVAMRSLMVLPEGAVTVKAKELPVVSPAKSLSGMEALKPPESAPDVIGVMFTLPEIEFDRLVEILP